MLVTSPTRRALAVATLLAAAPLAAQQATSPSRLTAERIFDTEDFSVQERSELEWMADGRRFAFIRDTLALVVEDAATGRQEVVLDAASLVPAGASAPVHVEGFAFSGDERRVLVYTNSQRVWRDHTKGEYYVFDRDGRTLTPISRQPGWQMFAKLSPDGTKVGFVRDNDLYVTDLGTGRETRLTSDGGENIINGTFDWVYEEELGLQDGWRWSPDGRRIAFWRLDQSPIRTFFMIQETDSLYPQTVPVRYPKAGTPNSIARIGVVPAEGGATTWMDTGTDPEVLLARMEWAASSGEVVIQRMNRIQNRVDVLMADAGTGRSHTLFTEESPAWIDVSDNVLAWVNDGRQFVWASDRDGWMHLYLYNRDGSLARQLTRGAWDVTGFAGADEEAGWVYFGAAEEGPVQRHLYRVRMDGRGAVQQLSREPGWHEATLSPTAAFYLEDWSTAATPTVTRVHRGDGAPVRVVEENTELRRNVQALAIRAPEFFTVPAADGTVLNAWMIKPADFDPAKKYPVLMYVYGGPGSQTVMDRWGSRRYLYHQMLAQHGYIVMSVDNRGTGARGRAFRTSVYLHLGENEAADQLAAAAWLARQPYVDPARIGLWGWSYGGYMTAFTLTRPGAPFRAGISVAPVVDWELYDTIYTERFMRTPQENGDAYERTAPVNFAADLRARYLLVHGTGDDNVHAQNTMRWVDALQAADRQFGMMLYANRTHSIDSDRADVHLHNLMLGWLQQNL